MSSGDGSGAIAPARPLRLLRAFLLVGAAQGYAIGLTGLLKPESIVGFPLETTPLNDRFVASFYLAGAIGLTLSALARRAADMRVLLTAFSFVTVLLLAVTIGYWSEFTTDGIPYPWLISYSVDPILGSALIVWLGLWSTEPPRLRGLGLLFLLEAAAFIGLGGLLLGAPGTAIDAWPWLLTTILARLYGSIFIALGLGALLAAQERRAEATIAFLGTSLVFAVCGLVTYALHRSRFDGSTATDVWLAAHGLATVAFGIAIFSAVRSSSRFPGDVPALAGR
jgi:hypothetical protein